MDFIRLEEAGGDLTIGELVDARITVTESIDTNGRLLIEGDATDSDIWINAIGAGSVEIGFTKAPGAASVANTDFFFNAGIATLATLDLRNARMIGGSILLGNGFDRDLNGTLLLYELAGNVLGTNMTGTLTVTSDFSSGNLGLFGNMSGSIAVGGDLGGDINIGGNYAFFGTLDVGGSVTGNIIVGGDARRDINIGQSLDGTIQVNQSIIVTSTLSMDRVGLTGLIDVADECAALILITHDFDGIIDAGTAFTGQVNVGGDANGSFSATGASAGFILVDGHLAGDVTIPANMSGNIHADADGNDQGDITGNVTITGVYDGDICGANLSPGGLLPTNIVIQGFGPSGSICGGCLSADDCADLDANGIRDDSCVWWACDAAFCQPTDTIYPSDMGGAFGACPPDDFCNVHDRTHALTCFAGTNGCDTINIDAGGPFGACPPDGFCNIHDAYHADKCFKGVNPCSCPGGSPAPMMGPGFGGATGLVAVPVPVALSPNVGRVRIYTTGAVADIRGYQLDPVVSGGTSGQLELLDVTIEPRADFVFAGRADTFEAFNLTNGQMLCGVDDDGVATTGPVYLATYTYRVPPTAAGDFVLDIRRDEAAGDQTFLIATNNGRIAVNATTPSVVSAGAASP